MGDNGLTSVAATDEAARMEATSTHTMTKTVHETEGLCIVGARVVSESGKVESSVELPRVTTSDSTPDHSSSSYSSSQVAAHTATPEKEEHTVTSFEEAHTKTSMESVVRLEPLLEGGLVQAGDHSHQEGLQTATQSLAAQTLSQSQSVQSSSQSSQQVVESLSQIASQSQSVQDISQSQITQGSVESQAIQSEASQSVSQSEVSEAVNQPVVAVTHVESQAQVVDENANIQQQQEQQQQQQQEQQQEQEQAAPPPQQQPEVPVDTPAVVEAVPVAERVVESKPIVEPEVAAVVESKPEPESQPVTEPQPGAEEPPVGGPESVVEQESSVQSEEPHVVEPKQNVEPAPESVVVEPQSTLEPQPAQAVQTEPVPEYTLTHEPQEAVVEGSVGAEISQENIRSQLHEIITEIEQTVLPEQQQQQQQEEGVLHHTWRPKGQYEIKRTPIKYEDVVPIEVPDVKLTEQEVPKPQPPPPQPQPEPKPQPRVEVNSAMTNGGLSPSQLSPIEIPEGIPLLARILPKDDARENGAKIPLERLFTPATDSGDLTPKKKKAYASSAFYRPDHPTIDDQVELAQRISFSLVDENNKLSRGQSMYMKRKKRASRWIHQGGSGTEGQEDESPPHAPMKPAMKLLMNPKGVQDFHAVQQHYQTLMESAVPTSPEINKIVTEVQSPTGKGAELFAKRKKRMDKFIVDETTVQKAQQQQHSTLTQQTITNTNTTSATNTFTAKKQAEMERKKQQDQIMLANTVCDVADSKAASWMEMPKPVPLNAPPINPMPTVPHHSLHDFVNEDAADKRRSVSFNLAAKGWGTYNNFYTPITFATS